MSKKFKVGTSVVPTKECMKWYRNHIGECYSSTAPGIEVSHVSEILLWAMSDKFTPVGVVIPGNPENEHTVRVSFTSKYGTGSGYFTTDHLLKKRARATPKTLQQDKTPSNFCAECNGPCILTGPKGCPV